MSRSGFRGRGGGPGSGMLKGATWEHDAEIKLESKPSELFPTHPNLKRPASLMDKELRQIEHYRTLQKKIHRGPLYTQPTKRDPNAPAKTFGEDQFNRQYGTNRKADFDPFNGVETYSSRYAPKKNDIPKLSGRPFNKELFPKELWDTLDGTEGKKTKEHINRIQQRKAALLSGNDPSAKAKALLQKIHEIAGDDDADEADPEAAEEEEVDDEFDDDDMGDDYNAEQYFDGGEDGSENGDEDRGGEDF